MPHIPKKRAFVITGTYPEGLTRTEFRRLKNAEKLEIMIEWFQENYEDPAERTPYETAEGGYQWIWGGPYDAREEIEGIFGAFVPEKLIDRAVEEIESDGQLEWASARSDSDYEDEPLEPYPHIDDDIPDEPGSAYGTEVDWRYRRPALAALSEAEAALNASSSGHIGHNQPPESITDEPQTENSTALRPVVSELKEELEKATPSISLVKRLARRLGDVAATTLKWTTKKLDVMADEAAKTVGKALAVAAVALEPHVQSTIEKAFDFVVRWLHIVTLP